MSKLKKGIDPGTRFVTCTTCTLKSKCDSMFKGMRGCWDMRMYFPKAKHNRLPRR